MSVREALLRCGRPRQGLATAALLRAEGVTRSALSRAVRRGEVVRVHRGVYAAAPLGPWPVFAVTADGVVPELVQHVRAAMLSLGEAATVGARTAACLRGWGLLVEPLGVVDVVVPRGRHTVRLARARVLQRRRVQRERWTPGNGAPLWITTAVATVLDCCRELAHEEAVVVCDSALRSRQVSIEQLRAAAERLPGLREARRVRRVLADCDPDSGSVLESVLRVRMVQDGLTGFATQRVLRDARGRRVHRVDFCFERARLVVEADGASWHQEPTRDRGIDNRLAAAGWRVLRFTWAQVLHDPAAVLDLVRAALDAGSGHAHLHAWPVAQAA